MKRKKRIEKGVKSLKEQIAIHEEKKKQAEEANLPELVKYYEKEISGLEKTKDRKEDQLEKN
ncbi:MAG: hypothetical protein PHH54_01045 [Candidatus Nanoarchaeia archaeon]|nr:hypothetical protein [Candidatus Nanoarchaeia archaeon]MDD5740550.1 hypothetical protein [Candidatus Nanoarchaeia archaeon]